MQSGAGPNPPGKLRGSAAMSYPTPVLIVAVALVVFIAWLVGVEPWMLALGAGVAIAMFLVERGRR